MNYDVLLNRTGFGRMNIGQQQQIGTNSSSSLENNGSENDTPTRKISSQSGKYDELSASPSSSRTPTRNNEELKVKVESKLMTIWNNVKFGWSGKIKPSFSKEQPVWLLGRCYHQKATPVASMESSVELTNSLDNQLYINDTQPTEYVCEAPPEETGTDAIEDSSPDALVEEEGMEAFKRDFISRLWMTYRREFPTMNDSNFTSDCGWGCMIRSGQMMLAQGLLTHFLGRSYRWDPETKIFTTYEDNIHRRIIRWFGDTASKNSPFSIHTLVNLGKESGKKPGDWYGPGAVAHLLRQSVKLAAQEITDLDGVNVYVAQDCAVYIQDIIDECTVPITSHTAPWQQKNVGMTLNENGGEGSHWKSLILLVPLRLGTERLNPIYNDCLKAMLSLDYCIGIIGGRPRHSLYFIGYQEDKLIHLDPHYCQDMVDVNQENFQVSSFHCKSPRKLKLAKMDPCCCIGFYCETRKDFFKFVENVKPFLLPVKQNLQGNSLNQFNEITYPMFVFCRGKSSEQQVDLPPRMLYQTPPEHTQNYFDHQKSGPYVEDDDDDDDETVEFVIL